MGRRHILLSPDKFKGSLTAAEVASAVAAGVRDILPDAPITLLPVADGGDGTVAAAVAAGYTERTVLVEGPTGEPVRASYAVDGERAVVELACACGIGLLPGGRLAPLSASTYGLGQVVADALDTGAREVVIGLGGSASTDGGSGVLQALGAVLLDGDRPLDGRGATVTAQVSRIDLEPLARRVAGVRFLVATDVDNPLLGDLGAAAVFGPQKGASAAQVAELDAILSRWATTLSEATGTDLADRPGAGAAGGTGFAALAVLGAEIRPGIDLVLDLVDFDRVVAACDLVVTGEGSLDAQSLAGKAPIGVARAAARRGVPVVAVAGRTTLSRSQLAAAGISRSYTLTDLEPDTRRCMDQAAALLRRTGQVLATEWSS